MTKRKKTIYAAILALGAAALLIDRLLSPPSVQLAAASDRPLTALGVETPEAPAASVAAAPVPAPRRRPSERSEDSPFLPVRDLFATTDTVRTALLGVPDDPLSPNPLSGPGGLADVATAAIFEQEHRLTGVMVRAAGFSPRGDLSIAVVDGVWLRVGDTLDGCKLIDITGAGVSFQCAGGVASLSAVTRPAAPGDGKR